MRLIDSIMRRMGLKSRWEIWLDDPKGQRLALLERAVSFWIQRVENEIGAFQVVLPGSVYDNLLRLDGMVEFWRAPAGGSLGLEGVGLARVFDYADDENGLEYTVIEGPDQNDLLGRRIVAYAAGTAYASKADYADDLIKAIWSENYGSSATDSDRDLSGLGLSVQADSSLGESITKGFSWRDALKTIQEVAQASAQAGTAVYFDLVPYLVSNSQIGFRFMTTTGQLGIDHTASSGSPAFFGKMWGNLNKGRLRVDYWDEATVVYAGGQGEGSSREIVELEDTNRSKASIWNRREIFADARNESTTAGVTAKARAVLEENKPRKTLGGDLLDTPQTRYGRDWHFGDKVTIDHRGQQYDARVTSVRVGLDSNKAEIFEARYEVDE